MQDPIVVIGKITISQIEITDGAFASPLSNPLEGPTT